MTDNVSGTPKWTIAVQSLNTMIGAHGDRIRFGLELFPDLSGDACTQDAIAVPVSPDGGAAMSSLLTAALERGDAYYPNHPCATNIDAAMARAATEPALGDQERPSYVLLLTDGKQSPCSAAGGDAGTAQIIADLFQNKGVPTFVLGFGSGVDPAQMDIFAEAGGVPSSGAHRYYDATEQADLDAALQLIATTAISCSYTLADPPGSGDELYVFLDNAWVARDPSHQGGWDYDPPTRQVTFYGNECNDLKIGAATDIDVVFGCDQPTPD